jgi:hypothetical protein
LIVVFRRWLMRTIAAMTLVGLAATAGVLGFWASDREIPTKIIRQRLLTPEVVQGGEMQTERVVNRDKLCYTTIDRYMIDAAGQRFDLGVTVYPNGTGVLGEETFVGSQPVPERMAPGEATFTALPCYYCNPVHWLWPLCEEPRTRTFVVIKKSE